MSERWEPVDLLKSLRILFSQPLTSRELAWTMKHISKLKANGEFVLALKKTRRLLDSPRLSAQARREIFEMRAEIYRDSGELQHAMACLSTAIAIRPDTNVRSRFAKTAHLIGSRAECRIQLGDYEGALRDYTSVATDKASTAEDRLNALFHRACVRVRLDDSLGASRDLRLIMAEIPADGLSSIQAQAGCLLGQLTGNETAVASR